jgi:CheY-like chemotaxis protein
MRTRHNAGKRENAALGDLGSRFVLSFQGGVYTRAGLIMSKRILVVDDSRYAADAFARLIAICGYETKAVYSGREAMEQSVAFAPDMVLMDIGMPELDGYETATRIRLEQGNANVLLVAVTCWTEDQDKQRAYESGFNLHVPKPLSLTTLYGLLALLHHEHGTPATTATRGS